MSYATVLSCALAGISPLIVTVEVNLSGGLPGMSIVGLPQSAVRESKDRVRAAIQNSGFHFPACKVVVNLAPADLPKQGGRFDLPIALGVLMASRQLPSDVADGLVVLGELGLSGEIRPVKGVLPTAVSFAASRHTLLLPQVNAVEAAHGNTGRVCTAATLAELCRLLQNGALLPCSSSDENVSASPEDAIATVAGMPATGGGLTDFSDVQGQETARRALEIAAAGSHNILLLGPPGTGKSMLAGCFAGILPGMSRQEAIEAASVASISHAGFDQNLWGRRPFRAPHHTASAISLAGGGSPPMPGEVSLAHNGVLFLDELAEFPRAVLDVLREPMETGSINISRAARQASFPARFQLLAAMNPCPCGHYGDHGNSCRCTTDQVQRYQSKISGPFLDRIDMLVHVPAIRYDKLRAQAGVAESGSSIRSRVQDCRKRQLLRQGKHNAQISTSEFTEHCQLEHSDAQLFDQISQKLLLSLRSHVRILRVARTIADLDHANSIKKEHLLEAVSFRNEQLVAHRCW